MQEVFGNTLGLKPSQLHALRRTYRRRVDAEDVVSPELARHLAEVSLETGRQIGVLLDRKGDVDAVIVGDARKLETEHERLQVEKRAQATPLRVEKLAKEQLQMRNASPAITQYVTKGGAAASAAGAGMP